MFKRGKTWYCDFTVNGIRVRESTGTTDKKLAVEYEAKRKEECYRGRVLKRRPKVLWQEAVVEWANCKNRKSKSYRSILRWLDSRLRGRYIDEITRETLVRLKDERMINSSPATVNRHLEVVISVLNKCYQWEWLDRVPKIEKMREPKSRVRDLTESQFNDLMKELPHHIGLVVLFAVNTGLRKGNILNLKWNDIDWGNLTVRVEETKNGDSLGVPLNEGAIEALRIAGFCNNSEYVFTFQGRQIKEVTTRVWRAATVKAGLDDFHFHDLRHVWASRHVRSGTDLYTLQVLAGWRGPQMAQKYAHLNANHLAEHAERVTTTPQLKIVGHDGNYK